MHLHTCTSSNTHTLPFFSSCVSLSRPLRGIYRDVKAVIGQVSGVELSDNRLVTVAAHEWGMERRRETEGIETLNSLLNQKNWKSGEFRLPAETERGGEESKWGSKIEEDRGNVNGQGAEIKIQRKLITIPRAPGVYFSICKRWLHYPEFNRSRLRCDCIKVRLIRRRIGWKTKEGTQIM